MQIQLPSPGVLLPLAGSFHSPRFSNDYPPTSPKFPSKTRKTLIVISA